MWFKIYANAVVFVKSQGFCKPHWTVSVQISIAHVFQSIMDARKYSLKVQKSTSILVTISIFSQMLQSLVFKIGLWAKSGVVHLHNGFWVQTTTPQRTFQHKKIGNRFSQLRRGSVHEEGDVSNCLVQGDGQVRLGLYKVMVSVLLCTQKPESQSNALGRPCFKKCKFCINQLVLLS